MNDHSTNNKYIALKDAKDTFIRIINEHYIEIDQENDKQTNNRSSQALLCSDQYGENDVTSFAYDEKNYSFGRLKNSDSGEKGRKLAKEFVIQLVDCNSIQELLNLAITYEAKAGSKFRNISNFQKTLHRAVLQCMNVETVSRNVEPINDEILKLAAEQQNANYQWFLLSLSHIENKFIHNLYLRAKLEILDERSELQHSVQGVLYQKLGNLICKPADYDKVENAIKAEKERDESARADGLAIGIF